MTFLSNIKNWLIGVGVAIIGFFVWKNNHDREEAEKELNDIKVGLKEAEIETAKKVEQAKSNVTKKELETKIRVLKDIGNREDKEQLKELETRLKGMKDEETVTITL